MSADLAVTSARRVVNSIEHPDDDSPVNILFLSGLVPGIHAAKFGFMVGNPNVGWSPAGCHTHERF